MDARPQPLAARERVILELLPELGANTAALADEAECSRVSAEIAVRQLVARGLVAFIGPRALYTPQGLCEVAP
ncbi:MAG TPA: hypothetical protein VEA41_00375 [Salinarimonas sp.]|nr:hypothetical protein [Salinarimonas sp.]